MDIGRGVGADGRVPVDDHPQSSAALRAAEDPSLPESEDGKDTLYPQDDRDSAADIYPQDDEDEQDDEGASAYASARGYQYDEVAYREYVRAELVRRGLASKPASSWGSALRAGILFLGLAGIAVSVGLMAINMARNGAADSSTPSQMSLSTGHLRTSTHDLPAAVAPRIQLVVTRVDSTQWAVRLVTTRFRWGPTTEDGTYTQGQGYAEIWVGSHLLGRAHGAAYFVSATAARDAHGSTVRVVLHADDGAVYTVNNSPVTASAQLPAA